MELRGIRCLELDEQPDPQKNMVVSRSFGIPTQEYDQLKSYIALFISRGAEKLRKRNLYTKNIGVFIRTSPFKEGPYSNYHTVSVPNLTNDTSILISSAIRALNVIYKPSFLYKKAGICFIDLCDNKQQLHLFDLPNKLAINPLMQSFDLLNKRYGKRTIQYGTCWLNKPQAFATIAKRATLSPLYTSDWKAIALVK